MARRVSRTQIVSYRLRAQNLDSRLASGPDGFKAAAWAGCKDSMPRAALLSLHSRVDSVQTDSIANPSLTQIWGPGFHAYVVAEADVAVFTMGRMPESGSRRQVAFEMAEQLDALLDDQPIEYRQAGNALGVDPNQLRYATLTGTVRLHWAGSGKPLISKRPVPDIDPAEARLELGRRFLRVLGPATSGDFGIWAGIKEPRARSIFEELSSELEQVETPIGEASVLAGADFAAEPADTIRLLPSGDVFYLLWGAQRGLLVPEVARARELWTSRVWPGAVLSGTDIVGTWRRSGDKLSIAAWRRLTAVEREGIEAEALSLPLAEQPLKIVWS